MPVKHDLYQDLGLTKDDVQKRRAGDNYLDALLDQYKDVDDEVLKLESSGGDDHPLEELKKKRLLIKDKIVTQLAR